MSETEGGRRFRRRDFLGLSAATVGSAWLAACDRGTDVFASDSPNPLFAKGGGGTVTRNPLRIPSVTSADGVTLTAAPGTANVGGGQMSNAWMYNGQFPGPTLTANYGANVKMTFANGLPSQHSITHWHGMIVDHADDGHPNQAVSPGGSYHYDFDIQQRAALNWYHPHPHMHTGEQVFHGLAGAFILRDSVESALDLPAGEHEVPLIIRDATFDSAGNLKFATKASGYIGTEPLVNGTRNPYLSVDKGTYRFRVLNGCNARVLRIGLGNGGQFTLIGNDGGLLEAPVQVSEITMAPGERVDLLVSFTALSSGATVMLRCLSAGWNLLEFRGNGGTGSSYTTPTSLSTITALSGPSTVTREFSFDGMTRINGLEYQMERIDFNVTQGVVERWRFRTNGNAPHPVHVHGASFQVMSRTGGRGGTFPWENGWKDTVLLADRETVDVLIKFERKGLYVLHCHQLAHEDQGMMSNFEVV
jgi:FtsP/CotA-like multicopper oxidase with cupredoxin domain